MAIPKCETEGCAVGGKCCIGVYGNICHNRTPYNLHTSKEVEEWEGSAVSRSTAEGRCIMGA